MKVGRRTYSALAAWLVVTVLLAVCGRGTFGQGILLVLATFAALGCWATGGLIHLFAGPTSTGWREAGRTTLVIGAVLFGSWASFPLGRVLLWRDIAEAKAYCEALIPEIERFKAKTGRYPETPPDLDGAVALPRLLRKGWLYHATDVDYSFLFVNPGEILCGFTYDGSTGRWDDSHGWD